MTNMRHLLCSDRVFPLISGHLHRQFDFRKDLKFEIPRLSYSEWRVRRESYVLCFDAMHEPYAVHPCFHIDCWRYPRLLMPSF